MKSWMTPITPLTSRQEVRVRIPWPSEPPGSPRRSGEPPGSSRREDGGDKPRRSPFVTLYLAAGDAGDGAANDFVVWQQPRFLIPGRPDLPLRDVRAFTKA